MFGPGAQADSQAVANTIRAVCSCQAVAVKRKAALATVAVLGNGLACSLMPLQTQGCAKAAVEDLASGAPGGGRSLALQALDKPYLPMRIEQSPPVQSDDRAIKDEGLDALTDEELRHACRARGMRTPYGEQATDFMRRQLQEWLDLSLNR